MNHQNHEDYITVCYGKWSIEIDVLPIKMVIFNSYVNLPEGNIHIPNNISTMKISINPLKNMSTIHYPSMPAPFISINISTIHTHEFSHSCPCEKNGLPWLDLMVHDLTRAATSSSPAGKPKIKSCAKSC